MVRHRDFYPLAEVPMPMLPILPTLYESSRHNGRKERWGLIGWSACLVRTRVRDGVTCDDRDRERGVEKGLIAALERI